MALVLLLAAQLVVAIWAWMLSRGMTQVCVDETLTFHFLHVMHTGLFKYGVSGRVSRLADFILPIIH